MKVHFLFMCFKAFITDNQDLIWIRFIFKLMSKFFKTFTELQFSEWESNWDN
jgi:hypothetical protein